MPVTELIPLSSEMSLRPTRPGTVHAFKVGESDLDYSQHGRRVCTPIEAALEQDFKRGLMHSAEDWSAYKRQSLVQERRLHRTRPTCIPTPTGVPRS